MPSDGTQPDEQKWWIDTTRRSTQWIPGANAVPPPAAFYVTCVDYEQERARSGLTDLNRKLLSATDLPESEFAYLPLLEERATEAEIERVKAALPLPPGGRGLVIDSGGMLRVLLTGAHPGERILEFNLNPGDPAFDVWVQDDWKDEVITETVDELLAQAPALIDRWFDEAGLHTGDFAP